VHFFTLFKPAVMYCCKSFPSAFNIWWNILLQLYRTTCIANWFASFLSRWFKLLNQCCWYFIWLRFDRQHWQVLFRLSSAKDEKSSLFEIIVVLNDADVVLRHPVERSTCYWTLDYHIPRPMKAPSRLTQRSWRFLHQRSRGMWYT
jgi:hypothetical protein